MWRSLSNALCTGCLLVVAESTLAQTRYFEALKDETIDWYVVSALHGVVDGPETHSPPLPHDFWKTDLDIAENFAPATGATLQFVFRANHAVAPHAGEPVNGPRFRSIANLTALTPVWISTGGGAHGEHRDDHVVIAAAVPGLQGIFTKYTYMALGIHNASGTKFRDALRELGLATPDQAVPPSESTSNALCAMILSSNGQVLVSVVTHGIRPSDIVSAEIRLGAPREVGVPVIDLGPASDWRVMEHGASHVMMLDHFPDELREPLLQGLLSVNIATRVWPGGEVRGWLVRAMPTMESATPRPR